MNAATICILGFLIILLTILIVKSFPTECTRTSEGFQGSSTELLSFCPAGTKSYLNDKGDSMCCRGVVNGRICEGVNVCTFSQSSEKVPLCRKRPKRYFGPIYDIIRSWMQTDYGNKYQMVINYMGFIPMYLNPMPPTQVLPESKAKFQGFFNDEKGWFDGIKREYGDRFNNQEDTDQREMFMEEVMYIITELPKVFAGSPILKDQELLKRKALEQVCKQ
jgi:hypothetical protein